MGSYLRDSPASEQRELSLPNIVPVVRAYVGGGTRYVEADEPVEQALNESLPSIVYRDARLGRLRGILKRDSIGHKALRSFSLWQAIALDDVLVEPRYVGRGRRGERFFRRVRLGSL